MKKGQKLAIDILAALKEAGVEGYHAIHAAEKLFEDISQMIDGDEWWAGINCLGQKERLAPSQVELIKRDDPRSGVTGPSIEE